MDYKRVMVLLEHVGNLSMVSLMFLKSGVMGGVQPIVEGSQPQESMKMRKTIISKKAYFSPMTAAQKRKNSLQNYMI